MLLQLLDAFFFALHTLWIVFCVVGWAWRRTRLLNLVVLLLTLASWTLLGIWYGLGYCPFTDWHWEVREALGKPPETTSYLVFMVQTLTGRAVSSTLVDTAAVLGLAAALLASITLNLRDWRSGRKSAPPAG